MNKTKKTIKRLTAFVITVCLLLGCFTVVSFAANEKYVARMYVCARETSSPFGHLWLYFENLTDRDISVGAYTLKPGQGVSVGTYGTKGKDGIGIYYNVESYSVARYGISGIVSLEKNLTASEMSKVSNNIKNGNFWEPIIYNCMGFAFIAWNSAATPILIPMIFPFIGRLQMSIYGPSRSLRMYAPSSDQVYRQRGNGSGASLSHVSSGMLSKIM